MCMYIYMCARERLVGDSVDASKTSLPQIFSLSMHNITFYPLFCRRMTPTLTAYVSDAPCQHSGNIPLHTRRRTHTHAHAHAHAPFLSLSLFITRSITLSPKHTLTRTLSIPFSLLRYLCHVHTHTRTHKNSRQKMG